MLSQTDACPAGPGDSANCSARKQKPWHIARSTVDPGPKHRSEDFFGFLDEFDAKTFAAVFVVRTFLEANWAGPSGSIYGMTATNQQHLRDVVNTGNVRPAISAMWNGIRTFRRIHFVGWQGVRVTLLEQSNHAATAPTYSMAYYQQSRSAAGREVHLLYPWLRSVGGNHRPYRHGITNGKVTLNLNLRTIEATNVGPGETAMAPHSAATVGISNLPPGPSQFHVTLGP